MPIKLVEHTYGSHMYMKIGFPDNRIEEIDVFLDKNGNQTCKTTGKTAEVHSEIVKAFNELY